jgi:hypothetical protein
MKKASAMAVVALVLASAGLPALGADVGVSVTVSQPGLYGRIDIGRVPAPPVLVYPQPVVIVETPVAVQRRPIYMHVPPGHAKDWRKHCHKYQACGQPVYFVQENWYQEHYAPRHEQRPEHDHKRKHDKGHGKGKHGKGKHD